MCWVNNLVANNRNANIYTTTVTVEEKEGEEEKQNNNNNKFDNFRFMWPCIINVGEERTNGWHK